MSAVQSEGAFTQPPQSPKLAKHSEPQANDALPPLTPSEYRVYNHVAEGMERYHSHFRDVWHKLYDSVSAADGSSSSAQQLKPTQLLSLTRQFTSQLTWHHTQEEKHTFPMLAERMPIFREDSLLHAQHHDIHEGIEALEDYANAVERGERDFKREDMRKIMDSFGDGLWEHLEREVAELGADKMRRVWSMEEIKRVPI